MAKRRNTKAEILADIERVRMEKAAAREEARRLTDAGAEAKVVEEKDEEGKTRVFVRGRRVDAFQLLLERKALPQAGFDAIRDYETSLATSKGDNTPERRPDHIRATVEGAPGQNVTQAMIFASHRVRWVDDRLSRTDKLLLDTLRLNPGNQWRHIVQMVTGERGDDAHAPRVRAMVENVRDALAAFDRLSKKAA